MLGWSLVWWERRGEQIGSRWMRSTVLNCFHRLPMDLFDVRELCFRRSSTMMSYVDTVGLFELLSTALNGRERAGNGRELAGAWVASLK